jgi:hypothetical protein
VQLWGFVFNVVVDIVEVVAFVVVVVTGGLVVVGEMVVGLDVQRSSSQQRTRTW